MELDGGDEEPIDDVNNDSDYAEEGKSKSRKKSKKKTKEKVEVELPKTVDEICAVYKLKKIDMKYTEEDFKNFTTFKAYNAHMRQVITATNPKIAMPRLVMMVSAYWRDFMALNPYIDENDRSRKRSRHSVGRAAAVATPTASESK